MANNPPPPPATPPAADGMNDDFFEQIFSMPYGGGGGAAAYGGGGGDGSGAGAGAGSGAGSGAGLSSSSSNMIFSLGLSLDHPINDTGGSGPGGNRRIRIRHQDVDDDEEEVVVEEEEEEEEEEEHHVNPNSSSEPPAERKHQQYQQQHPHLHPVPVPVPVPVPFPVQLATLFPPYGHTHTQLHQIRPNPPPLSPPVLHGQAIQGSIAVAPQPPAPRPRVRARRGQATDPHSIAERLRRERIAERIRALQELVPNTNKTDRAVMLDEIVDYVKFLRLQVKVLSMSRLGGAGAVAQLVADIPLSSVEGDSSEGRSTQHVWEKWSTDGTERQVAKLMEEDTGAAMQFLQSKSLCIMPISLAAAIYHTNPQPESSSVKFEPNPHS